MLCQQLIEPCPVTFRHVACNGAVMVCWVSDGPVVLGMEMDGWTVHPVHRARREHASVRSKRRQRAGRIPDHKSPDQSEKDCGQSATRG
ncbi:hypothetical protein FRAHR75_700039 [Frankia sp. Hr75.2]|nr:hypothetical protein FRAHR75_700039 [Frankia sp. Hr75.2]